MSSVNFLIVAEDLELAGLIWTPEIGDEVVERERPRKISILVDPQGMSCTELRSTYLWLPTVEQMVLQMEARQAVLYHTGLDLNHKQMAYRTVIKAPSGEFETAAKSLRISLGLALRQLLLSDAPNSIN